MLRTDLIAPVPALLARQARERGDKLAYSDARRAATYRELDASTRRLGGHLAAMGAGPGATVALMLPNSVEWIETCFATLRAGAISVPISYEATEPEIAYRLEDADCRIVVTTHERAALVRRAAAGRNIRFVLVARGDASGETGADFADLTAREPACPPGDPDRLMEPSFIVYTSGTTGRAKGVLLSQHSMLWIVAACWAPICGLGPDDTVLSPLPLFHSYALNFSVLGILATGASEHLVEKFSTQETLRLLREERFTVMPGVPTMFAYLVQAAEADVARFERLRLCISAGAIMPGSLNGEFEARFGTMLLDGYGITETSTMVTMNWPTGGRVPGSCGFPVPGLSVRVLEPGTGRDVETGREGELVVRGPNLMSGYHNKPEETAAALRGGWYHTGDLAKADANGFLTITGRLKELIIRGGQNIAPGEIEETVSLLAGVADCAVVAAPHPDLGEVPVLFVVPKPATLVEPAAILDHCRQRLSSYKVPSDVRLVEEIPRTGSGKIMRFKLAARLSEDVRS